MFPRNSLFRALASVLAAALLGVLPGSPGALRGAYAQFFPPMKCGWTRESPGDQYTGNGGGAYRSTVPPGYQEDPYPGPGRCIGGSCEISTSTGPYSYCTRAPGFSGKPVPTPACGAWVDVTHLWGSISPALLGYARCLPGRNDMLELYRPASSYLHGLPADTVLGTPIGAVALDFYSFGNARLTFIVTGISGCNASLQLRGVSYNSNWSTATVNLCP